MKKFIEPIIHSTIWIAGYILFITGSQTLGVFSKIDGTIFYPLTIGTVINIFLFYAVSLILIPKFSVHQKILKLLSHLIIVFLVLTVIESLVDFFFFTTIYSSEHEPFGSQLLLNFISNLIILSLALTYGFTKNWIKNERSKQKLKEEKLKAELNFLKAQINPHFLFNILNMAFSSATGNGDEVTANIIEKLAGLMRYMLYESNSEKVDINKEISYIENYISLQKLRMSSDMKTHIQFNVSGDILSHRIAPLILIPFVENAFKFGLKLEKKSIIKIQLDLRDNVLNFEVENTNFKTANRQNSTESGIGLENVKRRLELIYPNKHDLKISDNADKFLVKLKIDL
jgi:two-component system LytT family sensor kinase